VKHGLILFGHGARDPRWAEPFERLAARVRTQTQAEVRLAFLEFIAPDLDGAAAALIAGGVTSIHVVPVFFGQGGHVQRDLPSRVAALREQHPTVDFSTVPAIGEDAQVIEALADYCLRALEQGGQ
jgi:sirohydrochlorin cobaltochelatase